MQGSLKGLSKMSNCDCKPRRMTHSVPNSGTDGGTIAVPGGVYIWDIIVSQGATKLANSVTLTLRSLALESITVLALAATVADDNAAYAVMRQGAGAADGAGIAGTAVPFYIPTDEGIELRIGGSGIATNTAEITIIFSECPPPWR